MANTIKDATEQTKSHWETIQQWRIDEGKNYARSRSDQIARMGASGMREGTDQWNANLAKIDEAYEAEMQSQKSSATQGILDQWTKDMKKFYVKATEMRTSTYQTKNETRTRTAPSMEMNALDRAGMENPYVKFKADGGTDEEFQNMTTDDFMAMQFGYSEAYTANEESNTAAATAQQAADDRRTRAGAQQQRASPWWA